MKEKRVYSLDLFKLVLSYIIAFFHCDMNFAPGSTMVVPVFFLISGFFLGKKFYQSTDPGYRGWDYTLDHAKKLYPMYLFSCGMLFLYTLARSFVSLLSAPSPDTLGEILRSFYNQIPDIFLVQSSHFFHDSLNYPLWQVSALLIAGYLIYSMLCFNERLSRELLFPIAILMIQSLLISGVDMWANWGPVYIPLARAFSPMCVGVLCFYFSTTALYRRIRSHRVPFYLAGLYCLASLFRYGDYRNIYLIAAPIVILNCMEPESFLNKLFNHSVFRKAGQLSTAVYFNHSLVARVLWALVFPRVESAGLPAGKWVQGCVYFVVLTGYSLFTLWLVPKIRFLLRSHRQKARA